MPTREELFSAAKRLHAYLLRRRYSAGLLRGPDAGVRFNLRLWRFVKSALVPSRDWGDRCYARVLERQKADGSFSYSTGDYGFLCDRRSYPRPMAMTLFHLLYPMCGDGFEKPVGGQQSTVGS